jgi:hypothetical protein
MKRIDLYNKSRMMGDYQVRFCERLGLKCPCLLDCPLLWPSIKKGRIPPLALVSNECLSDPSFVTTLAQQDTPCYPYSLATEPIGESRVSDFATLNSGLPTA